MPKKTKLVSLLLVATALSISGNIYAEIAPVKPGVDFVQQDGKATGTVVDAFGPVVGASVLVKGTTNGNITDLDGNFTLEGVNNGDIIVISYIGYVTQEIPFTGQPINVTLAEDSEQLEEVVVTALGIKRSEKSLGYAMQQVGGDDLVKAREPNLANALSGKVSGVQVIRSSNGPGGSSKIQLRGANSVTGTNQPLIVVDGVPMDNFTGADNSDYWNPSTDMGNGLSDINPEDIESMSVLKGASAAALYGSRAGSGVILITTKKGRENPGLGITISSSVSAETIFMKPDMQMRWGQGSNGNYSATSELSWGPEITGQTYTKWDGSEGIMQAYDNVDNYFKTGVNATESISFSQMYGKTSIYSSLNRMDDFSKIPGADLDRTNIMLRASSTFGKDDRWSFDGKVQYIKTSAQNRPMTGENPSNMFRAMYLLPTSLDIREFENCLDAENNMIWWNNSGQNPYWMKDYNTNRDTRNRFLINASLKYQFTDWLNAEIRGGTDMYYTELENKMYAGSNQNNRNSSYALEEQRFYENNFSFLVTATKDNLFGKWGGTVTFGGNMMARKSTGLRNTANPLIVPNLFTITNASKSNISAEHTFSQKKINSLYGTVGVNYDAWVFLDATFRNDWTSTLAKENRSFFYPSVSLSWVISDMVNKNYSGMPEWFTYAKVRGSFAQVGNDMDPYQLWNVYTTTSNAIGNPTADMGSTLFDSTVKNELINSWEAGAELKFFNNRLGLDVAWYKTNAKNQLMRIPLNNLSGYSNYIVNAGNIQNQGVEIMLNATPVQTESGFIWDTNINFSKNENKIIELVDGVDRYELGVYDNLRVYAVAGGNYGEIWGTKFLRVTDESSPHYGKLLLSSSGLPQGTKKKKKIGDQQADCLVGWNNTFSYKNWAFSFQIDGRFGGDIFSSTNQALQKTGRAGVTDNREEFVVEGVISDGQGGYIENTQKVSAQDYWTAVSGGNTGINEANIYSATNIRLRNIALNYSFPKSMLSKTPFQQVKLGVSVNNVWMIYSDMNGIDPESVFVTTSNATGLENGSAPTSRSYLFNVTLGF